MIVEGSEFVQNGRIMAGGPLYQKGWWIGKGKAEGETTLERDYCLIFAFY